MYPSYPLPNPSIRVWVRVRNLPGGFPVSFITTNHLASVDKGGGRGKRKMKRRKRNQVAWAYKEFLFIVIEFSSQVER